jgi:hypothetical protein
MIIRTKHLLDRLIVTSQQLTRFERHEITDIAFDVNLQNLTNFSTLVVDQASWEMGSYLCSRSGMKS